MIRQAISLGVSILAGLTAIAALTREVGPVPSWLAFLCGTLVTLASIAQLRVRITAGEEVTSGDLPPARPGRHRRGMHRMGDRDSSGDDND